MDPPAACAWLALLTGARPADPARLAAALGRLNPAAWDALLRLAVDARLAALVAAHLQGHGLLGRAPAGVREVLRREQRRTLVAFTQQTYALARLAAAFEQAGVAFRVLKGLALAAAAYPVPAARAVGDLDLWIRPAAVPRAAALLRQFGLAAIPDAHGRPAGFLRAFGQEREFAARARGGLPVGVDLHWHLVAPWWMRATLRIPEAHIFARPQALAVGGRAVPALDPTDNLYYLCLHAGINHQFRGLRLGIDLAFLARSPEIAWPRLAALAAESGTAVIVWRGLELAEQVLGRPLTPRLGRLPARWHRGLVRRVLPGSLREGGGGEGDGDVGVPLDHLVLLPHPGAVAGALARLLWPPPAWIGLRYAPRATGGLAGARLQHLARLRHLWR